MSNKGVCVRVNNFGLNDNDNYRSIRKVNHAGAIFYIIQLLWNILGKNSLNSMPYIIAWLSRMIKRVLRRVSWDFNYLIRNYSIKITKIMHKTHKTWSPQNGIHDTPLAHFSGILFREWDLYKHIGLYRPIYIYDPHKQ